MATLAILFASTVAARSRASDPFEIQVYDGTANPVGVPGLELHLNDWATGHREATAPEAPLHGQVHWTLEPSLGVAPYWEIGAYVQFAARTDAGVFDWAGAKLRSKFVTPPRWDAHWRLGLNLELSYLPATYDGSRWGSEARPIVAWQDDQWLFVVNPILGQSFASPGWSDGPTFEPAAKFWRTLGRLAVGLEYYGTLGPIAAPLPIRAQEHYVFEVIDVLHLQNVELNFGVGEGLTAASAGIVIKAIVGYEFDTVMPPPNARMSRYP
jgi:hypothetical protein